MSVMSSVMAGARARLSSARRRTPQIIARRAEPVSVEVASLRDEFRCSATPLGSSDVAKRLECGVARRFGLCQWAGSARGWEHSKPRAAGYAALQTLRAIELRLGRAE